MPEDPTGELAAIATRYDAAAAQLERAAAHLRRSAQRMRDGEAAGAAAHTVAAEGHQTIARRLLDDLAIDHAAHATL